MIKILLLILMSTFTGSLLSVYADEFDKGGKLISNEYLIDTYDLLPSSIDESIETNLTKKGIDVENFNNLNMLAVDIPVNINRSYSIIERSFNNSHIVENNFNIKGNTSISDIEQIFNPHSRSLLTRTLHPLIEHNSTLNHFLSNLQHFNNTESDISNTTKVCESILKVNPFIEACQPNFTVVPAGSEVPVHIQRIGGINYINSSHSINQSIGIAIVDTGVVNHPDLNLVKSISCLDADYIHDGCPEKIPTDPVGHGTHVAGIAAAKANSNNVIGTAPGFSIYSIQVMPAGTVKNVLRAINTIHEINKEYPYIKVVNLSLGCYTTSDTCKPDKTIVIDNAIRHSINSGITYVIAAGNYNTKVTNWWPAYLEDAVVVTAIEDYDGKCGGLAGANDDTLWHDSNYDPSGNFVDIAAPGVNIKSTDSNGFYKIRSGTSQAAPLVAGVIASYSAIHPNLSSKEIEQSIKDMGIKWQTNCNGEAYGYFTSDRDDFPEPLLYTGNIN